MTLEQVKDAIGRDMRGQHMITLQPTADSLIKRYEAMGVTAKPGRNPAEYDLMHEIKLPTKERPAKTPVEPHGKTTIKRKRWTAVEDKALLEMAAKAKWFVDIGEATKLLGRDKSVIIAHLRFLGLGDKVRPQGSPGGRAC